MSIAKFSRSRARGALVRLAARRFMDGVPVLELEAAYGITRNAIYQAKHRMIADEIASTPEDELTD